jgi:hypothetical protein
MGYAAYTLINNMNPERHKLYHINECEYWGNTYIGATSLWGQHRKLSYRNTGNFFMMPSRNLVNVKILEMKLSEYFNRFYILNCNDDSFDDHIMNYGPIGSNHFNHQSAAMVLQTTRRPGWGLMQSFGGFLGFFMRNKF